MITIYGYEMSSPANKVRYVANALGLDYEYVRVDLRAGEHKKPAYLKLHPAGKVPMMIDGSFTLFESGAIIRYLSEKYNDRLYPKDVCARALVNQWDDFVTHHVGPAVGRIFFNRIIAPAIGAQIDERSLQDGTNFLKQFLPVVERQLGEQKNLAGKELSLADFSLLSAVDPAEVCDIDLSPYKALCAWRANLQKQDFYTQCHRAFGEEKS